MPVLSLHNTYSLPASYTLPTVGTGGAGLGLGLGGGTSLGLGTSSLLDRTHGTSLIGTGLTTGPIGLTGTGYLSSTGLHGLGGLGMSSTLPPNLTGLGTNTSYSTYTNPLLASGVTTKLKALDDLDLAMARHRVASPLSPLPGCGWDIDRYGLDSVVAPTYMHSQSRPLSRIGGLDLDSK